MLITEARPTKRGRISVSVDGEFLFAVEADAWQMSQLRENGDVTEEQLSELLSQSNRLEAKRRALDLLSMRDYTEEALIQKLSEKTGSEAARAAVSRMRELGFIDDEKYARRYIEELLQKGYAPRRIRFELQKRHISEQVCRDIMEQTDFGEGEKRAEALLKGRFRRIDDEAEKRRAAAYLERCGYSYSDIRSAIRSFCESAPDEE